MQIRQIAFCFFVAGSWGSCNAGILGDDWTLSVNHSIADKNKAGRPATLSFTDNEGGESSRAVDVALSLSRVLSSYEKLDPADPRKAVSSGQWDVALTLETHQNNQITKEQKTHVVGLSLLGAINTTVPGGIGYLPSIIFASKRDDIKDTRSALLIAKTSIQHRPLAMGLRRAIYGLEFVWVPAIGLEYERTTSADVSKGSQRANELRAMASVSAALWGPGALSPLSVGYAGKAWHRLSGESPDLQSPRRRKHFLNPYIEWAFVDTPQTTVSLRLERVSGEDPTLGLPAQKFRRLSFAVSGPL